MSSFESLSVIRLPQHVVDETQDFLRRCGELGREGVVLWAGRREGIEYRVSHAYVPVQRAIRTKEGIGYVVEGEELRRLAEWLSECQLTLLAQVHSHPTEAYHSDTDDELAIITKLGGLSLVVPDFAIRPFRLQECAVYRLFPTGWEALAPVQVGALITLEDA